MQKIAGFSIPTSEERIAFRKQYKNVKALDEVLYKAQEKIFDSQEATSARAERKLVKKALEVCPLCADAYILIAAETKDNLAQIFLYKAAIEAAELALGKAMFKENEGYFWGIIETRPYMRAKLELASILWEYEDSREEATSHYADMIRLNPHDNQGNRTSLLQCYVVLKRFDDMENLVKQYAEERSADWLYNLAAGYYVKGDTQKACDTLQAAYQANQYIAEWLLDIGKIVPSEAFGYALGSKEEAFFYMLDYDTLWRRQLALMEWLNTQYPTLKKAKKKAA